MTQHRKILDQAAGSARRLVFNHKGAILKIGVDDIVARFRHQLRVDLSDGCPCCDDNITAWETSNNLWVHEVDGIIVPCEAGSLVAGWENVPCESGVLDFSKTISQGCEAALSYHCPVCRRLTEAASVKDRVITLEKHKRIECGESRDCDNCKFRGVDETEEPCATCVQPSDNPFSYWARGRGTEDGHQVGHE